MKRIIEEGSFEANVALVTGSAVRAVIGREVQTGNHLAVDLPDERGRVAGQVFRVTLVRPRIGGDWIVDGLFSKKLTPANVAAVQAQIAANGTAGWKTFGRVIHVRHEGPWLATMQDVSRSGVGLISDRPFDPGTFLEISLPSIRRKHLQPRLIRVTHAKRLQGEDWALGGVFLRALTEQELQVLL
jgi:hypothetical protein